ncbi:heterogeneous nuclear ribonucleoprotein 1-like [Orbicella faveolata]|nr:heterogeneous nuclear ribonucleoprotein 1-like [Orbicella faveolata]
MYGAQAAPATSAAYGPSYGAAPTSAASMAATSGGYPDYSQMTAASQGGIPAAAPGAQPRLETPAAADYSAYGLGNYQQQESSYGPARTSFSSDASGYSSYGANADQTGYGPSAYGGGENFGRGTPNVSRGFHPYGR